MSNLSTGPIDLIERDAFWLSLERFSDRPAIVVGERTYSYQNLIDRADAFEAEVRLKLSDGVRRPLVQIEAANMLEPIVAYLAALRAKWPVILSEPDAGAKASGVLQTYRPNIVVKRSGPTWSSEMRNRNQLELHPDLAVMLSTSGTTGASKLVRLSYRNISSNASAIHQYLGLDETDRTITTLPWHYSYGMSVLHTQIGAGCLLVLTDHALTESKFWQTARKEKVTSLALVPVQFDILVADDFSRTELPSLRYLMQAGGKLPHDLAVKFARLSRDEGWKFYSMYGQTEAGPRISFIPPNAGDAAYQGIGGAIPGGILRIVDEAGRDVTDSGAEGELTYQGPNVMMGYALEVNDLALPGGPDLLRTGDIARYTPEGQFRIVGRMSRFIKLNGLRIGLDDVERRLAEDGIRAYCVGDDARLSVFLQAGATSHALRQSLSKALKLRPQQLDVVEISLPPLLPSGKVDYRRLKIRAAQTVAPILESGDLHGALCGILREDDLDVTKTFRELGGDSLSYLEIQLLLSAKLPEIPEDWDQMPLSALIALATPQSATAPKKLSPIAIDLPWRIAAICAILANHSTDWQVGGGAYFLLILTGYSLARFQSEPLFAGKVFKAMSMMLTKVLLWYFSIILAVHFFYRPLEWHWFVLAGNYDATAGSYTKINFYWYVSALVQIVLLTSLPFSFKSVRTWTAAQPLYAGLVSLISVVVLFQALDIFDISAEERLRHTVGALELSTLGWCIFFARQTREKLIVTVAALCLIGVHWHDAIFSVIFFMVLGSLSLIWSVKLRVHDRISKALFHLGSVTMLVYLVHPFVLVGLERALIVPGEYVPPSALFFGALLVLSFAIAFGIKIASALGLRLLRLMMSRTQISSIKEAP